MHCGGPDSFFGDLTPSCAAADARSSLFGTAIRITFANAQSTMKNNLFRLFLETSPLDLSWRKLPGVLADAPPPEETLVVIDQYDAHVGPESIPVDHGIVLVLYL